MTGPTRRQNDSQETGRHLGRGPAPARDARAAGGGPPRRMAIDRRGVSAFLAITFALTYSIEGALILAGFRISPGGVSAGQFVILAVMWVPAIATVLTVRLVTHEGFAIANIRIGPWRPYLAVGAVIPACFVVIYSLTALLGLGRPDWSLQSFVGRMTAEIGAGGQPMPSPSVISVALYLAALLVAPFFNAVFGFGEELGWRGYLLPKLLPLGKLRAYLLVGIIWGLWHLPLVAVGFTYPGHPVAGVILFTVLTTAFGAYLNQLTLRHRSSVLAGWAHGVFNSQKLGVYPVLFPDVNPLLGGYAGVVGITIWSALGVLQARSRTRTGRSGSADPPASA